MINPHKNEYPAAFEFMSRDLPALMQKEPGLWGAFKRHSNLLTDAEALEAVTFNDRPPLIFAADLGTGTFGVFDTAKPGRIKIGTEVLKQFAASSDDADSQQFLRAKVLHEICHWGCFKHQARDEDEAGENFEKEVFGRELLPDWLPPLDDLLVERFAGLSGGGQVAPAVLSDPLARADLLAALIGSPGFAPGRNQDPDHAVFGGIDVAEAMPRGYRNNNPGNIRIGSSEWRGFADPAEKKPFQSWEKSFCVFREPEWGLRALAYLLKVYKHRHGLYTPRRIISRWAPAADNNDVASYAQHVADALNIGPDDRVDADDDKSLITMMRAIAKHENGERPPYAEVQYRAALLLLPSRQELLGAAA
jgi:hypothetical protein